MSKTQTWEKVGGRRVVLEPEYGKGVAEQDFKNPVTGDVETHRLFSNLDSVHVLVIIKIDDEEHVICVQQYKQGVEHDTLELPGGTFRRESEPPEEAARRWFTNETGVTLGKLEYYGSRSANTRANEALLHFFCATDCTLNGELGGDDPLIETKCMPLDTWVEMIAHGEISDTTSIALTAEWGFRDLLAH